MALSGAPKALRRSNTAGLAEDILLPKPRYGFGVSWDAERGNTDIDLQCVVVDNNGVIIDCAYYNNLKAVRAITHSGDEIASKSSGMQELVWVNVRKLPEKVSVLLFVVAAFSGGYLRDVNNACFRVLEERESNEMATFGMTKYVGSVQVLAAMHKNAAAEWNLRLIDEPAQQGQHFMDILPLLSECIRLFVPTAPKKQKVAFAMEKGGVMDLPQAMQKIVVGLGWDCDEGEVDLDVSAVLLDEQGVDLEAVFFGRPESEEHGIVHTGDNETGEGEGDDEQIIVGLDTIGPKVNQVFFVVNIYSPHKSFRQVASPYCRVIDQGVEGSELCRYALRDAGTENGLIVAKIAREAGGRWGFHALGLPCRGRTYKDSLPQIRQMCKVKTSSLLLRGSTGDLSNPGAGYSSHPISSPMSMSSPPEAREAGDKQACCTVQ